MNAEVIPHPANALETKIDDHSDRRSSVTVGFVLFGNFSLISFASAIEPLRVANLLSPQKLYRTVLAASTKAPVYASNGIPVTPEYDLKDMPPCDLVVICAGYGGEYIEDEMIYAWLRRIARNGTMIAGLGTGAYLLARSGLLDGRRCTVHWENFASIAEEFPHVVVNDAVFLKDGQFITCAGGASSLDMMLELIAQQYGRKLSKGVADQLVCGPLRQQVDRQLAGTERFGIMSPELKTTLKMMEDNIQEPLTLHEITSRIKISERKMQRLFRSQLGVSPGQYYLEVRIHRARALLIQTPMPISEIAMACGFSSTSHFSNYYKKLHKISPIDERKALQASADRGLYIASALQRKNTPSTAPQA